MSLINLFVGARNAWKGWRDRRRAYDELMALDDYALADIGIRRSEIPAIVEGFAVVKAKTKRWFERCAMEDLEIEGPFINGDTFLVVLTFVVRVRATGETRPIREFAVFVVESGKIAEERHFY